MVDAAERRPTAWLALQAHDQGHETLDSVIGRFEQLTRLDPTTTWDWLELGRLYQEQGRLADAKRAVEAAYQSLGGSDEPDRVVALTELGDVARQAGDLAGAKAHFEEGLAIARKLAQANLSSAVAQRDLSLSLERLGDVAVKAGDLAGAKARFEEGAVILRKLAQANPTSTQAQRDVSISFEKLGEVAVKAGDLGGAKARFEEGLAIFRKLAQANPMSAEAQRDLIISLFKLGLVAKDRSLLREALQVARGLEQAGRLAPTDHRMLGVIAQAIDSLP